MTHWFIKIGVLAIIILLALNLFMPVQSVKSAQKYQYKALVQGAAYTSPSEYEKAVQNKLNEAASDGWEYVSYDGTTKLIIFRK
ncbi:exported hypothetical protein [Syntrophobacter sp. SbD1]|nr:exported hypothetical protein [Syntrophobacter sp. SbD1]